MDAIMQFIRPELFVLIIFLYAVGLFVRNGKWKENSWLIPYILLAISLMITIAYVGFVLGEGFSPSALVAMIIQSVLIAAVTVYGNELIEQIKNK
ncbi:MAG: phage holin family protein [Anaerovoracaceae bacterium]|jgi:drug/metabolite transporter (DMT)-like permease